MAHFQLKNISNYSSLWQKIKGVIGDSAPTNFGDGIALPDTNSVHTFFVSFPIDLIFLDKNSVVIRLVENLKPWRISPIVFRAKTTLEIKSGTIREFGIKLNDSIEF